jgi:nitrite reductase/ring-hydroxylating ferredoxin subunit
LVSVAVYRRELPVSLERVWENVLDWEHLPWLHSSSFSSIECLESGVWGWRARLGLQAADPTDPSEPATVELILDRPKSRYVVRTLEGFGRGTEIWTRLESRGKRRSRIQVEFCLPDVEPNRAEILGAGYTRLYQRLWDEDEAMMRHRQAALDNRTPPEGQCADDLVLGSLETLRSQLPRRVEFRGRVWRVVDVEGKLMAHAGNCPHMLGPLDDAVIEEGCIRCPWHGYVFELGSGRSADGRGLCLARAPQVRVEGGMARLVWGPPQA